MRTSNRALPLANALPDAGGAANDVTAAADGGEVLRVEVVETETLKVLGQTRWIGKAKFPKAPRPRSVVIFQFDAELIAIPSACPHEQASLAHGRFVEPYVIECPLHQNTYDLRTGAIKAFRVEMVDDRLFLLWHRGRNEPLAPTFSTTAPLAERADGDRVRTLEAEIAALHEAADLRAQQTTATLAQMNEMIVEVEARRDAVERAHRDLAQANEFIGRVTDTMSEVLLVCDRGGTIRDANRRAAELTGSTREGLVGRGVGELVAPADELAAALSRGVGRGVVDVDAALLARDGERIEHLFRAAPMFDATGKRQGSVVVGTDVRSLKRAQREIRLAYDKVSTLLNSMRQGVFVIDERGVIHEPVSRVAQTMFGRDIAGASVYEVLFRDLDRRSEAFLGLETALLASFGAEDFQWDLVEHLLCRRVLYRRSEGSDDIAVLRVDYRPLRDDAGLMDRLMVMIDDVTRVELLEENRRAHERETSILSELTRSPREGLREFFAAAYEQLREVRRVLERGGDARPLFRALHTLKGNARVMHLGLVGQAAHEAENRAAFLREPPDEASQPAMDALRAALDGLFHLLREYGGVAHRVLHIPDDHERQALTQTHHAMTALDRALGAGLLPSPDGLSDAVEAVVDAATALAVPALFDAAHTLARAPRDPDDARFLQGYAALSRALLDHIGAAASFPLASLSAAAWSALLLATFRLTLAAQRPVVDALELERAIERARVAAASLRHDYALLLLTLLERGITAGAATPRWALRDLWRHLALHSALETRCLVRPHERAALVESLTRADEGHAPTCAAWAELGVQGSALERFFTSLAAEGISSGAALDALGALFDVDRVKVAGLFCAAPAAKEPCVMSDDEAALHASLGAAPELLRAEARAGYLKRCDTLRLVKSVLAFRRGDLQTLLEDLRTVEVMEERMDSLRAAVQSLAATGAAPAEVRRIERAMSQLSHTPLLPQLQRYRAMVADVAAKLGKRVELQLGGDPHAAVARDRLPRLREGLVHLLRNALDHGIEDPAAREAAGKLPEGTLELHCRRVGDDVRLTVRDDGRGVDTERLRAKALSMGLVDAAAAEAMSPQEALDLIFLPHLSTSSRVTDISGRGIGMDIARSSLAEIGGELTVVSHLGQGTEFTLLLRSDADATPHAT